MVPIYNIIFLFDVFNEFKNKYNKKDKLKFGELFCFYYYEKVYVEEK